MALRQIGVKPFFEPMLINHGLDHTEHISVKKFAGLSHIQLKSTSFLGFQNSAQVFKS